MRVLPLMNNDEKRQFTRVPFVIQVHLSQNEQLWLGHVVDISFKGILVTSSSPFAFDEQQPIVADISFDNGSNMKIKALQAHNNEPYYGFKFLEMDLDAMTHLRNIIMLNLGDDSACERELTALYNSY